MNKKSNKFVLLLCVLMMIMPFFTFNVNASDVVIEDFDSYAEGVYSGINDYVSWEGERSVTSTSQYVSSPLGLRCSPLSSGHTYSYFNLTSDIGMSGFEYYFRHTVEDVLRSSTVSLQYSNGTDIVRFKHSDTYDMQIYDYNTYYTLYTDIVMDTWYCFGFQSNYSVGNPLNYVYYYLKDSNGALLASVEKRWISLIAYDNEMLGKIVIDVYDDTQALGYIYYDDFTILDYTPPEYEGEFGFESYGNIGNLDTQCFFAPYKQKELEFKYHVPVTINATGFDLLVAEDMHQYDDNLLNYDLYINGEFMNNPTEWKKYGNYYILRWIFSTPKVIINSEILYELWHDETVPINYWKIGIGCTSGTDLDGDNYALLKFSNTYPNSVYDGTIEVFDVAYQIYYENIQFPDDETYFDNDYIYVINETHYCGEPVWLTYMLTSMATDTYVRIWNDDASTEINDGTFPYTCPTTSETIGFVAETSANYTAKLYRNSVELDNDSFFVNNFKNPTNYVYTKPNPCYEGESYLVKYAYDNANNYDGAIFLSNTPDYRNYFEIFYVLDGDSGSYSQKIDAPCTLYYILAVNKNSTYYVVDNGVHQHIVKSRLMKNYFTLGNDNLALVDGKGTQSINGETTHIGGNCRIYDNNKLVLTITESTFNEFYTVTTAGMHKVEMRLITNETTVLYTQNYTVSGIIEDEEIEDTSYILQKWLYDNYGNMGVFIAGVGIVIGFMFIPFALVLGVNVKYNKNIALGDLHWSIYLIFAIVGVIVDVQLHLAELWIILLVCVISIAITAINWNSNR